MPRLDVPTRTIQFLLGVTFFGEPLQGTRLAGFVVMWSALVVYSADGFLWLRRQRAPLPA